MNRYDMSDYLHEIEECCSATSNLESPSGEDRATAIKSIQDNIKKFSVAYKKDSMNLYEFADRKGKYAIICARNLNPLMDNYEDYHTEMVKFINQLADIKNERTDNLDKFKDLLSKAYAADASFGEKLFAKYNEERIPFVSDMENVEMMVRLVTFIDEVYDNYIKFSSLETESGRIEDITRFYHQSVTKFLKSISEFFIEEMKNMFEYANGGKTEARPVVGNYQLI
jgi:hypothetical protein